MLCCGWDVFTTWVSSLVSAIDSLLHFELSLSKSGPVVVGMEIAILAVILCYALQFLTGCWSQVDRWWSIAPAVYSLLCLHSHHDARLVVMSVLVCLWAARLTFNFWRRGGFSSLSAAEDYRWEIVRAYPKLKASRLVTEAFSFGFVSMFQNVQIWLFTSPIVVVRMSHDASYGLVDPTYSSGMGVWDWVAAAGCVIALVIETVADQQQYNYQEAKWAAIHAKRELTPEQKQGFRTTGLFRWSRHPNYFGELAFWFSFYLFSIPATGCLINTSALGPAVLLGLFHASTQMSEEITATKYPLYKKYQKLVPIWIPTPPSSAVSAALAS